MSDKGKKGIRKFDPDQKRAIVAAINAFPYLVKMPHGQGCAYTMQQDDTTLTEWVGNNVDFDVTVSNVQYYRHKDFGPKVPLAIAKGASLNETQAPATVAPALAKVPPEPKFLVDNMNAFRNWVEEFRYCSDVADIVAWLDDYGDRELGDTKRFLTQAFFTVYDDYDEARMPRHWKDRTEFQAKTRRRMRDLELALRSYLARNRNGV